MDNRQKTLTLTFVFLTLFSHFSFASCDKQKFFSSILPEIQKAKIEMEGVASEIPTSLVLSQIILESGICGSSLSKKTKNLVGIKGGGKQGKEYARFRRPRDCIKYYLKTLSTHKAYEKLREHLDDSNALTLSRYLKRYAEDPQYTKKIANVIKTHDLMRFDV